MTESLEAELAKLTEGRGPLARITELMKLGEAGRRAATVRFYGHGLDAAAELELDDGTTVAFESVRMFSNVGLVNIMIATTCGIDAGLDTARARQLLVALRGAAGEIETIAGDFYATELGIEYLQSSGTLDADLADQGDRFRAFEALQKTDPWHEARFVGGDFASACRTLRARDGRSLVRTSWFRSFVRQRDPGLSPPVIATRMQRAGWRRPGSSGKIKATRRSTGQTIILPFFVGSRPIAWCRTRSDGITGDPDSSEAL